MISHSINGQTYTTVYAHLNSRSVGNMQTVSKGQVIGYMGNTGDSFGQHLHFELHRGGWNAAKSNAINPSWNGSIVKINLCILVSLIVKKVEED